MWDDLCLELDYIHSFIEDVATGLENIPVRMQTAWSWGQGDEKTHSGFTRRSFLLFKFCLHKVLYPGEEKTNFSFKPFPYHLLGVVSVWSLYSCGPALMVLWFLHLHLKPVWLWWGISEVRHLQSLSPETENASEEYSHRSNTQHVRHFRFTRTGSNNLFIKEKPSILHCITTLALKWSSKEMK